MLHITDLLELIGLVLLVVAAALQLGAPAAVATAGGACLWVSYGLTKARK